MMTWSENIPAILFLLAHFLTCTAWSQLPDPAESASSARIDLAVPDAPAFAIMGLHPAAILQPGTVRELAIIASDFLSNHGNPPGVVAAEFAPWLIAGNVSLREYQKSPFLYRLRISFASSSTAGRSALSGGVRLTLADECDLRMDTTLQKELMELGQRINFMENECANTLPDSLLEKDPEKYSDLLQACLESSGGRLLQTIDSRLRSMRENARKRLWNKKIIEIGFAGMGKRQDSAEQDLRSGRYAFWLTCGLPIAGNSGQLIVGLQGGVTRDSYGNMPATEGAISLRCYAGSNSCKGYIEGDYTAEKAHLPGQTIRFGGEIRIANGVWLNAMVGYAFVNGGPPEVENSLNFRISTPEE